MPQSRKVKRLASLRTVQCEREFVAKREKRKLASLPIGGSAMTSTPLTTLREAFHRCRDMDASLDERLSAYSKAVRENIPAYADAVDQLVSRLRKNGAGHSAPQVGDHMPLFILPDETGRLVSLRELLSIGPVALTFHRGHWCPWCRINVNALVRVHQEVAKMGGRVVAIMPERRQFAAEFKRDAASPFPVLTDIDNGYALSLNLAIWLGLEMKRLLTSYGRSLRDYQGNDAWMVPIPATFLIGRDGKVKASFVDPDFRRRMTIEDFLMALRKEV